MSQSKPLSRRAALTTLAGIAGGALTGSAGSQEKPETPASPKALYRQSVCRWCFGNMTLDDLCRQAKAMGLQSVELLTEKEWAVPKQHGLTCAVAMGPSGIVDGWNRPADHDRLVKESERLLPLVAEARLPHMIVFSGNRRGLSDAEGLENCAKGLKRIIPMAEQLGVTVIMELLNSKVDHKDYQCDRTAWGVELVKRVGSERFKLLYDIYHMQIMEGDVIRTIQENKDHIAHFHTAGVPGRHEIDETQELNYRRIFQAIAETRYAGFIGHEFLPRREPMASLKQAVTLAAV